jgi:hypothetical protein
MILLVVLTLLTLFALVGISFVLVAGSQETSARIARESETQFKPNVDPEAALAFFLGQFLYDVNGDTNGVRSSLRGHSLGRGMYGWWDGTNPGQTSQSYALNDKPFTGTGRLFADQASGYLNPFFFNPGGPAYWPPACQSDSFLMNYQFFSTDIIPGTNPPQTFVRDPERIGWRGNPTANFSDPNPAGSPQAMRWYAGGANVPYTYPDHNNFFLAQIDPNDGFVLVPSFHREYLFGRLDLPATPANGVPQVDYNPNWNDQKAKYLTLRPTPAYHNYTDSNNNVVVDLPMPIDRWGDVKNLDGFPGGADSIWIDVGAPVMIAPQMFTTNHPGNVKKPLRYKMLVAPLILELDSRVNLNVVGNWLGQNATDNTLREHRSNQGWGMWEVNPSKVLNYTDTGKPTPQEWLNIFLGSEGSGAARIRGRHDNYPPNPNTDPDRTPKGRTLSGGQGPRVWAQVDYDALRSDDTMPSVRQQSTAIRKGMIGDDQPAGSWVLGLPIFNGPRLTAPNAMPYGDKTYNNGGNGGTGLLENNTDHPAIFNVARPTAPNRRFPVKDMAQLLRFAGSGSDALGSELMRMLSQNLVKDGGALRRRNLITLLSADLDRPGVIPFVWKPDANNNAPPGGTFDPNDPADAATRLRLRRDLGNPRFFPPDPPAPATPLQGLPSLVWDNYPADNPPIKGNAPIPFPPLNQRNSTPTGEFDGRTWRSTLGDRGRLDLGRAALYPYPTQAEIDADPQPRTATTEKIRKATVSRQALAGDIFETLRRVTGAMPTNDAYIYGVGGGKSEEFQAIRYLAQLAVNIVDYIDTDDISTPFAIPGLQGAAANTEWVFGFELPRLVVNEVYAAYDNDKASMNGTGTAVDGTNGKYALNVWAELMNAVPEDYITVDSQTTYSADCKAELFYEDPDPAATGATDYAIYRMLLVDATAAPVLRDPANTLGNPDFDMPAVSRIKGTIGKTLAAPPPMTSPINWTTANRFAGIKEILPLPAANRYNDQGPPAPGAQSRTGFYFAAPLAGAAGRFDWVDPMQDMPNFQNVTFSSPELTWGGQNDPDMPSRLLASTFDTTAEADRPRPMVILQRLANPRLPFNNTQQIVDPTDPNGTRMIPNPNYNPYVTVDHHECHQYQVEYGRRFDTNGNSPTPPRAAMAQRVSWGRNQPFAAFSHLVTAPAFTDVATSPRKPQAPNAAAFPADVPKNTFLRQNSVESNDVAGTFNTQATDPNGAPPAPYPALTNGSLRKPFDWLVHLDRAPISAGELLHVSALRPYDVLQYFVVTDNTASSPPGMAPPPNAQHHKAPWLDPRSRLYRFLEFVSAVNDPYRFDTRTDPVPPGQPAPAPAAAPGYWGRPNGRVQGKINLNMVMTTEPLYAMADWQNGNSFNQGDIDPMFNAMLVEADPPAMRPAPTARTPKVDLGPAFAPNRWRAMAGPTDRRLVGAQFSPLWTDPTFALNKPFWGYAFGYSNYEAPVVVPNNDPLMPENPRGFPQSPLRRPNPTDPVTTSLMIDNNNATLRTFNDYQSKEILAKIFNNFTTRSNVFAVWVTVGFFEVVDETTTPVKLGAEVGKAENRHVRYRTFSIVDRSQMTAFSASSKSGFIKADQYTKAGDPNGTSADQAPGTEIQLNWSRTVPPQPLPPTPATTPPPPPANSVTKKYFVMDGRTGREWEVTDGTILVFDPNGDNEEIVVVKSYIWTDPMNAMNQDRRLYANFMRAHGDGAPVICHGNPGPMDRYDPRTDTDVVPYFQLID